MRLYYSLTKGTFGDERVVPWLWMYQISTFNAIVLSVKNICNLNSFENLVPLKKLCAFKIDSLLTCGGFIFYIWQN